MLCEQGLKASVSKAFLSSPKLSHKCFYSSMETHRTRFLFLVENTTKEKQLVNFNYQNMHSLCSYHHYANGSC